MPFSTLRVVLTIFFKDVPSALAFSVPSDAEIEPPQRPLLDFAMCTDSKSDIALGLQLNSWLFTKKVIYLSTYHFHVKSSY